MNFKVKKDINGKKGSFYAVANEQIIGEMLFSITDENTITIEHTEVQKQNKGEGVGKQLLEFAVNDARANQYKIIPKCPFVESEFEKHSQFLDVKA